MNKRKNGFTLIELLAVIVILAIIALIATPIVLNIINDTNEQADLRSADFYLDAVELGIAQATLKGQNINDGTYTIIENGNICLVDLVDGICPADKILTVEVKGKVPSGTITITKGQISEVEMVLNDKTIVKDSKGELVYVKTLEEICEYSSGTEKNIGSKYECKVDPNKAPYTFYVLSYTDEHGNIIKDKTNAVSINLIMDSNVRTGGEPVKELNPTSQQKGTVPWISTSDFLSLKGTLLPYDENICYEEEGCASTDKGPITLLNYLEEATKNWTNTNEIKISEFNKCSENTCVNQGMDKTYQLNARMPYYSELKGVVSLDNLWLINYLSNGYDDEYYIEERNEVTELDGYWTLSCKSSYEAWYVDYAGILLYYDIEVYGVYGVRPVINLKLN